MMRLGRVWATTSPRSYCSIMAPSRPRLGTSSAGLRPVEDQPTNSATGAAAKSRHDLGLWQLDPASDWKSQAQRLYDIVLGGLLRSN
jgi:hypothetical protein